MVAALKFLAGFCQHVFPSIFLENTYTVKKDHITKYKFNFKKVPMKRKFVELSIDCIAKIVKMTM